MHRNWRAFALGMLLGLACARGAVVPLAEDLALDASAEANDSANDAAVDVSGDAPGGPIDSAVEAMDEVGGNASDAPDALVVDHRPDGAIGDLDATPWGDNAGELRSDDGHHEGIVDGDAGLEVPCDDGNPCTSGFRGSVSGNCLFAPDPRACEDLDPCTVDSCSPETGCSHLPMDCDDGDACTVDQCIAGICHRALIPGCDPCRVYERFLPTCECTIRSACDDGLEATVDLCDPLSGTCTNLRCETEASDCSDGDACTRDCRLADGECSHSRVDCDDKDPLTQDRCEPSAGCVHQGIECPMVDPCLVGAFDASTMSCRYHDKCDDGDICTTESCDPLSGQCLYVVTGTRCTSGCFDDRHCEASDACHWARCDVHAAKCVDTPIDCDDRDCSTRDYCEPATGLCRHEAIEESCN